MDELKQTPQQENPCAAQGSPCAGCAGCGCQAEEPVPQDAELVADLTEAAEPAAERPADTEQNTAVEEAASAAEEADHAEEEAALAPEPEETAEPAQPEWVTVVDIHFRSGGKV